MRKSVTKVILDAYLRRKGVMLCAGFKGDQIGEIRRMWNHNQKAIINLVTLGVLYLLIRLNLQFPTLATQPHEAKAGFKSVIFFST